MRPLGALALTFLSGPILLGACAPRAEEEPTAQELTFDQVVDGYTGFYFDTYPSRATTAGRTDWDSELESFGAHLEQSLWLRAVETFLGQLETHLHSGRLDDEQLLDGALLEREMRSELYEAREQRRFETDPLKWSGIVANATVFLLVRDDRPSPERFRAALQRAHQLPALASQGRDSLAGNEDDIAPEFARIAASQLRRTAEFYRTDFARPAAESFPELSAEMADAGETAAAAIDDFAVFMDDIAQSASGSFRLGDLYAQRFALITGDERPVSEVLAAAEAALVAKREETAGFVREIWSDHFDGASPDDDVVAIRRAFDRIAEDTASSGEAFIQEYRGMVDEVIDFVRERNIVAIPDPLPIVTDSSPAFFLGAGGGWRLSSRSVQSRRRNALLSADAAA